MKEPKAWNAARMPGWLSVVVVLNSLGILPEIEAAPGDLKWQSHIGTATASPPAIGTDGTIYVVIWLYHVFALDGKNGDKRWEFTSESGFESTPAVGAEGIVYVGGFDGRLYALDGATGLERWHFKTEGPIVPSAAIGIQ